MELDFLLTVYGHLLVEISIINFPKKHTLLLFIKSSEAIPAIRVLKTQGAWGGGGWRRR